ncbi:MAG: FkbM family methyltransferase [Rhodospirillales bacterium]
MVLQETSVNADAVAAEAALKPPTCASWFDEVRSLGTAEAMRAAMHERYPFLDATRLRRLAIVGAAAEGQRLARLCTEHGITVVTVADDNPRLAGTQVEGVEVSPLAGLAGLDPEIPVIIASHRPLDLTLRLRALGCQRLALFLILQVLDPARFPPHMFYDGWFEDTAGNLDKYDRLAGMFSDPLSINHLDAILGFRLTGDIAALVGVVDWSVYEPKDLFAYSDQEIYLDGGAFDGDSINAFINRVGGRFQRAIGFEPDPKTFAALQQRFAGDARITAVPAGLHRDVGEMRFGADGSRGAKLGNEGDIVVPVTAIDTVLAGDPATFIKMNIEGAELDALNGARETIARWKPRLAISSYHMPSHLWQVPFLIKKLNPAYKVAIKQHDLGVIETVTYGY